jgi:formamidopyrimidine-DNA glycosylase
LRSKSPLDAGFLVPAIQYTATMPELPEVETSRRGISPHLVGERISRVVIRDRRLRWLVSQDLERQLTGATVDAVARRAKYLLIHTDNGTAIVHLGLRQSLALSRPAPLRLSALDARGALTPIAATSRSRTAW